MTPRILRLNLLGRFEAWSGSSANFSVNEAAVPVALNAPHLRALMAYLALRRDHSVTREKLATLLWCESTDRQARQNLRQGLLVLRKILDAAGLGDILLADRETVSLRSNLIEVDAHMLERLTRSDTIEDLDRGDALYRGDLLDGLSLESETFDTWLRSERARLRASALSVLERASRLHAAAGRGADAIDLAERWAAVDPDGEAAHRVLIELTAQYRGRTAALTLAAGVVERIRSDTGGEPEPETLATIEFVRTRAERPLAKEVGANGVAAVHDDMRAVVRKELESQSKAAILVLPIICEEAQSPQLEQEAARLTSDLIDFAPTITNLRVIAKSVSSRLDVRSIDVSTLGREFGADYAVEGSLRDASGRLRVDIALIDLATRLQVWNGYFESDESDAAMRRREIVRGLSRQLLVATTDLLGARPINVNHKATLADRLLKGWFHYQRFHSFRGGEEGQHIFEEILLEHPENRSALLGLSSFKIAAAYMLARTERQSLIDEAEQLTQRALAIDSQASLTRFNLGEIALLSGQVEEAVFRYERTLAINPTHAPTFGRMALIDLSRRRFVEGLDKLKYVVRLSPNDWNIGYWYSLRGRIYFEMGEDAEAGRWLRNAMLEAPNRPQIRAALAALHFEIGHIERARKFVVETRALAPAARYETVRDFFFPGLTEPHEPRRMLSGLAKAFADFA